MSGFSEAALETKLAALNNSQQSIQQLSLWIIHHKKHVQASVKVWFRELGKTSPSRKLTFLYLANDVVQNARKKTPDFGKEFGSVLKKVLEHLACLKLDDKTIKAIARLLNIWQERQIFDQKIQTDIGRVWTAKTLEAAADDSDVAHHPLTPPPQPQPKPPQPPQPLQPLQPPQQTQPPQQPQQQQQQQTSPAKKPKPAGRIREKPSKEKESVAPVSPTPPKKARRESKDSDNADDVLASLLSPAHSPTDCDPPEPEELIKALQDLEYAASSDAVVREKIARLPPEVSESSYLAALKTTDDVIQLVKKVDEATQLLSEYNERLAGELRDRKRVGKLIRDFISAQRDLEAQAEERLEQYKDKLDKVNQVREDLRSHIQSLPDLTKLPDVTGGLAPLPSAGDLFMLK